MKHFILFLAMALMLMVPAKSNAQFISNKDAVIPAKVVFDLASELPDDMAIVVLENLEIDSDGNVNVASLVASIEQISMALDENSSTNSKRINPRNPGKITGDGGSSIQEQLLQEWLLHLLDWLGWLK